ncbi:MAG: 3-methyl-2-oxobutanoate dehydrogenase subunit VorB [Thermodesulfobacteriota bacterium]
MRGAVAIGEAAVRAGCRYYFGYPITPQNELPEYMSARLPEVGGVFIQGESEIASVNMVIGAAAAGGRVMTSSSSPGFSLKQEAISYLVGMELPAVLVNIMRGGPGLGNIAPSQADYFQATRGGGHGDYRLPVLAPAGIQELADLTYQAFELADRYRNPVLIAGDGLISQMMEPVILPEPIDPGSLPAKDYIADGCQGRGKRALFSYVAEPQLLHQHNLKLQEKFDRMAENEQRWEAYLTHDAETVIVAWGTAARIAKGAVNRVRRQGHKVGLFRPISLWPFPKKPLRLAAPGRVCVFELSAGQMIEDVLLAAGQRSEVFFYGTPGGPIPNAAQVAEFLLSAIQDDGRVGEKVEL